MNNIKFRTLREDEIEVRIQSVTEKGCILLLYKDSRTDMNILDETIGPFNWKREHTRDNSNCILSLWDKEKQQWVSKEDTGTESNTEKEKGLASDSFKRAAFNWGIGRELYTAPFIWVKVDDLSKITCNTVGSKKIYKCNDKFKVEKIAYSDYKVITGLSIINITTNKRCFLMKPQTGNK